MWMCVVPRCELIGDGFVKEGVMRFSRDLRTDGVRARALWLALVVALISPSMLRAQSGQTVTVDQATMQTLLQRIDQLEARVRQLEAAQHSAAPVLSVAES